MHICVCTSMRVRRCSTDLRGVTALASRVTSCVCVCCSGNIELSTSQSPDVRASSRAAPAPVYVCILSSMCGRGFMEDVITFTIHLFGHHQQLKLPI